MDAGCGEWSPAPEGTPLDARSMGQDECKWPPAREGLPLIDLSLTQKDDGWLPAREGLPLIDLSLTQKDDGWMYAESDLSMSTSADASSTPGWMYAESDLSASAGTSSTLGSASNLSTSADASSTPGSPPAAPPPRTPLCSAAQPYVPRAPPRSAAAATPWRTALRPVATPYVPEVPSGAGIRATPARARPRLARWSPGAALHPARHDEGLQEEVYLPGSPRGPTQPGCRSPSAVSRMPSPVLSHYDERLQEQLYRAVAATSRWTAPTSAASPVVCLWAAWAPGSPVPICPAVALAPEECLGAAAATRPGAAVSAAALDRPCATQQPRATTPRGEHRTLGEVVVDRGNVKRTFIHFEEGCKDAACRCHSAPPVVGRSAEADQCVPGRPEENEREDMLAAHQCGECKPCAFFYSKADGCRRGNMCKYCHQCNGEDFRRYLKEKRERAKALKAATKAMGRWQAPW